MSEDSTASAKPFSRDLDRLVDRSLANQDQRRVLLQDYMQLAVDCERQRAYLLNEKRVFALNRPFMGKDDMQARLLRLQFQLDAYRMTERRLNTIRDALAHEEPESDDFSNAQSPRDSAIFRT